MLICIVNTKCVPNAWRTDSNAVKWLSSAKTEEPPVILIVVFKEKCFVIQQFQFQQMLFFLLFSVATDGALWTFLSSFKVVMPAIGKSGGTGSALDIWWLHLGRRVTSIVETMKEFHMADTFHPF